MLRYVFLVFHAHERSGRSALIYLQNYSVFCLLLFFFFFFFERGGAIKNCVSVRVCVYVCVRRERGQGGSRKRSAWLIQHAGRFGTPLLKNVFMLSNTGSGIPKEQSRYMFNIS